MSGTIHQVNELLAAGTVPLAEHYARYWVAWAAACRSEKPVKRVWDLGCGDGGGSAILTLGEDGCPAKREVVGVEQDETKLNAARRDYGGSEWPTLTFERFGLENHWHQSPVLSAGRPDLIVAFDLLERLWHRDFFLLQAAERLSPNGSLILSADFRGRQDCHASPPEGYRFYYNRPVLLAVLRRFFARVHVLTAVDISGNVSPACLAALKLREQFAVRSNDGSFANDIIYCEGPI